MAMEPIQEDGDRSFGLRPRPSKSHRWKAVSDIPTNSAPDLQITPRPYISLEPICIHHRPLEHQLDGGSSSTSQGGGCTTPEQGHSSVPRTPVADKAQGQRTTPKKASQSLPKKNRRDAKNTAPAKGSLGVVTNGQPNKSASPFGEVIDLSGIPVKLPFNKGQQDLWRKGKEAVRRSDGSVDPMSIINWIMTRKGGVAARWSQLEEGYRAIHDMRRELIDVGRVRAQIEEEEEEERRKEERRLANKRKYRPRVEWVKEREAKAKSKADTETKAKDTPEKANKASDEGLVAGEPPLKRMKLSAH